MDTELKEIFEKASRQPLESEIFAKDPGKELSIDDVFSGDESLHKLIEKAQGPQIISQASQMASKAKSRIFTPAHMVILLNIIVISSILGYLIMRPATTIQIQPGPSGPSEQAKSDNLPDIDLGQHTEAVLDQAVSWKLAEDLFYSKDFLRAYYVYKKLNDNLTTGIPSDEFLKDFIQLKIALCLQNIELSSVNVDLNRLYTIALNSRSPVVRAMANYHLMFIELHKQNFIQSRSHAYQTLALYESINDIFSENMQADCYFVLSEALTRHVLHFSRGNFELPGKLWSTSLTPTALPSMDQNEVKAFLQNGVFDLSGGVLSPKIGQNTSLSTGRKWYAVCLDIPFEEVISQYVSEADLNLSWQTDLENIRNLPVTMYLPSTSEQMLGEFAAGSKGLIAKYDLDQINILNPNEYTDLNSHIKILASEGITVWRRFLIRFRGDHRTANAHYALGLLQEEVDQPIAALGEYKLITSQHSHSSLAPYSLLNSSKIKTNLNNYEGAKSDLSELIIQYHDFKEVDQASLYLANATMKTGMYEDAIRMFHKVYNLDLNISSQRQAAYGIGESSFLIQDYDNAQKWLTYAINMTDNTSGPQFGQACLMLGKSHIALKQYDKASNALRLAFDKSLTTSEYTQIVLQLVHAEQMQGNFIEALNLIEKIPLQKLSQSETCDVVIAKASVLRDIHIADAAITILRRRIEFIANSQLRGRLSLEIAKCFIQIGDWLIARQRLTEAVAGLPAGAEAREAKLLLIETNINLNDLSQAKNVCLQFLNREKYDRAQQAKALNFLGQIYTRLNQHDKASLAYVGVYDKIPGAL